MPGGCAKQCQVGVLTTTLSMPSHLEQTAVFEVVLDAILKNIQALVEAKMNGQDRKQKGMLGHRHIGKVSVINCHIATNQLLT